MEGNATEDVSASCGDISLTTAPRGGELPFRPDALVREEDTFLVLSAGRRVEPPEEPTGVLRHRLDEWEALEPGWVAVRRGPPVELLAVVHDLDREPTWRARWVAAALEEVVAQCARGGVRQLALPVLGAVHGDLGPFRFLRLLRGAVASGATGALERICVRYPRSVDPRDARALETVWRNSTSPGEDDMR